VHKALARRAAEKGRLCSLIENGALDTLEGWRFAKEKNASYSIDKTSCVTGSASLMVVCDGSARAVFPLGEKLKALTRYRLSFFVRLDNVKSLPGWSGVVGEFFDGENYFHYPKPPLKGTSAWMYQEVIFTTPNRSQIKDEQKFQFLLKNVKGTAWFDDVRIEEFPENKK
jgi:hypothetical protein